MSQNVIDLIVLASGFVLGSLTTALIVRRLDKAQIEGALDTVGIRRKEFLKLLNRTDSTARTVAENSKRIAYLEKTCSVQFDKHDHEEK